MFPTNYIFQVSRQDTKKKSDLTSHNHPLFRLKPNSTASSPDDKMQSQGSEFYVKL